MESSGSKSTVVDQAQTRLSSFSREQWLVLAGAVAVTIALRFVKIPGEDFSVNFSSVIALTLLCGSVTGYRMAVLIPLGIRLITDVLIYMETGYSFFPSWPFDYSAYVLIFFIGRAVPARSYAIVFGGTIVSVLVYFLLSNFGVWVIWPEGYPRSMAGLASCFVNAIPFVRGTVLGNLLMAPLFFFAWNAVTQSVPKSADANAAVTSGA